MSTFLDAIPWIGMVICFIGWKGASKRAKQYKDLYNNLQHYKDYGP